MVILSIVSYVASGLIAKTYIGYNQANAVHKANLKVENAISLIVNRLEYAIDGTIVKRRSATDASISSIDEAPDDYEVLEWVGYDKDGFEANDKVNTVGDYSVNDQPAWSGFCNIAQSTSTTIVTPGSNLTFAQDIINRISNQRAGLTDKQVAIFFPGNYDYTNIGYKGTAVDADGVGLVNSFDSVNSTLTLESSISRITEHYKLAWSAYAVVPINYNNQEQTFDLVLRYNFKPWNGEHYDDDNIIRSFQKKIATNVTVFKTYATENRIHIKLCVKEKYGISKDTSVCKEKVVFR